MSTTAEKVKDAKFTIEDLSPETVEHSKQFEAVTWNGAAGTYAPGAFEKALGALGVTKEEYVKVQEAEAQIHRSAALGGGQSGIKHLKANPELTHVSIDLPTFGKDRISVGVKRAAPYTIKDAEGNVTGTGTTYGAVTVDHKSYSTKKRGEMTKISSLLNDIGASQLA